MRKTNRKQRNKLQQKLEPTELTCITIQHQNVKFVALVDTGANCSIVGKPLLEKLNKLEDVVWEESPVKAFTGESIKFLGYIDLQCQIGHKVIVHRFFVQDELQTSTDCLLGGDFLTEAQVTLSFSVNNRSLTIQGEEIALVEQEKRICKRSNTLKVTYAVAEVKTAKAVARSCDYRRVEAESAVVVRVTLPGDDYPAQVIAAGSNSAKGHIVEKQVLTTRRHIPNKRAKCRPECKASDHIAYCPTVCYWYAYALVYNTTEEPIYIKPGQAMAEIEKIYENEDVQKMVHKAINNYLEKIEAEADQAATDLAKEVARKEKRAKQKKQKSKNWIDEFARSKQNLQVNFLDLDPIKNKEEFRKRYIQKHNPPLDLDKRKIMVEKLLNENPKFADLHEQARELLLKYPEVVSLPGVRFVGSKTLQHRICYTGPVFFNRQYKTAEILEKGIQKEIDQMLHLDLIEPGESEYNSALLPVVKRNPLTGEVSIRLVSDYRKLNLNVIIDRLGVSDVQTLLNKLQNCKFLTKIDLKKGYNQIPLTPDSRKYTAFRWGNRSYVYKKLPFGLGSSPAAFIKLMNIVTAGLDGVFVYMDDILVYANSEIEHAQILDKLYKRLSFHGLEISLEKCEFFATSVEYLGYELTTSGIKPQQKLIKPMLEARLPTTLKEARSLCSLFSFYRKFIRNYSIIAEPLIALTRDQPTSKGDKIAVKADAACEQALAKLKEVIRKEVCLKFPDFSQTFVITSDASTVGIGAALSQRDGKGCLRPLAYASRSLNKAERRYPAVELEALGIVYALRQFRQIILGYPIAIETDHKPLVFLLKHPDPNSRLYRYQLELLEYQIENIAYIEGGSNSVADYLSRWTLAPDESCLPTMVCHIESLLASSASPTYRYGLADKVDTSKSCLIAFCGNARNLKNPDQNSYVSQFKDRIDEVYKNREELSPDIMVAKAQSCPQLGEIVYEKTKNPELAIFITNVFDKLPRGNKCNEAMSRISNFDQLISENFKFDLRNDKYYIRDYYTLVCLEELLKYCLNNKHMKLVQFIWPSIENESNKRIANYRSLLTNFGYVLWQNGIEFEVIGQPEFEEDDHLVCAAVLGPCKAKSWQFKEKIKVADIIVEQKKDKELNEIREELEKQNPSSSGYWLDQQNAIYKLDQNFQCNETARICIPLSKITDVLKLCHDENCHPGISRSYHDLKSQVFWPNMLKDLQRHVNRCEICIKAKLSNNNQVRGGHLRLPPGPGHTLAVDILGGLPKSGRYNQILVVVCAYSRFTKLYPMSSGTATEIIECLSKFFSDYDEPSYIISDNAGSFVSTKFEEFLADPLKSIKHHLITPYNPSSNLSERIIRDVLSLLRVLTRDNPKNWHEYLPQVATAINLGFNTTLQERPFTLFFGHEPKPSIIDSKKTFSSNLDINENYMKTQYARDLVELQLSKAHQERDKKWQTTGRLTTYETNDIVYLKRRFVADKAHKIRFAYIGPFKVTNIIGNSVVLLNLANGKLRRASMKNLKIYKHTDLTPSDHINVNKAFPIPDDEKVENEVFQNTEVIMEAEKASRYNLRSKTKK